MNKRAFEHTHTTPVPKRARTDGSDLLTSTPLTNKTPLSLASPRVPPSPSAFETFPAQAFTQFVQDIKFRATRALQENEEADASLARERQWQAEKEQKLRDKQALLERLLREKEETVEAALDRAIEAAQRPVAVKRLPEGKLQMNASRGESDCLHNDGGISGEECVSEGDLHEDDEEDGENSAYSADELALPGDQRPAFEVEDDEDDDEDDEDDDEDDERSEDYDQTHVAQPLEILSSDDDDIRHSFRPESAADNEAEYEDDVFDQDGEASLATYEEDVVIDAQSGASVMSADDDEVAIDPNLESFVVVQAQHSDVLTTNELPLDDSHVAFDELPEPSSAEASDAVPDELIPVFDDDDEAVEASSAELNNEEDRYDNEPEEDHVPIDVLLERGDELSEQDLNTLRSPRHEESLSTQATTHASADSEPTVTEDLPEAVADASIEEMLFQEMDRARRLSQLEQQRPIHILAPHSLELPIAADHTASRRSSDAPRESVDGAIHADESSVRCLPPRKRSDATKRPALVTDQHALHAPVFALSPVADSPDHSPHHSGETCGAEAAPPASIAENVTQAVDGTEAESHQSEAAEKVIDVQDKDKVVEAVSEECMTVNLEQEAAVIQDDANALDQVGAMSNPPTEHAVTDAATHHSVEETTTAAAPAEPIIEDLSHIVDATEKGFHVARSAEQVISVQDKLVEDQAGGEVAPVSEAEIAFFDKEEEYLAMLDTAPVTTSQNNAKDARFGMPALARSMEETSPSVGVPGTSIIPDDLVLGDVDDDAFESQAELESDSVSTQGDLADFFAEVASEHDETERVGGSNESFLVDMQTKKDATQPDQMSMQDTTATMEYNSEPAESLLQAADTPSDVSKIDVFGTAGASQATSTKLEAPVEHEEHEAASSEPVSKSSEADWAHQSTTLTAIEEEPKMNKPVDAVEENPEADKQADENESAERLQTPPPVDNPERILHTRTLASTSPVPVIVHRLRDGVEYVDDGHDLSMLAEHDESHHEVPVPASRRHFKPRVVIRRSSRSRRSATPDDAAIAEASMKSAVKVQGGAATAKSARQTRQASIEPAEDVRRSQRKK